MPRQANNADESIRERKGQLDERDYEAPEVEDAGAEEAPAVTAAGLSATDTDV
jgi:hypothetical protein